jgi:mRNA interferase MazF
MNRGEVWFANLPDSIDSIPAGSRPVLIVQSDRLNRKRSRTAIVVPFTTNQNRQTYFPNVLIGSGDSGLRIDSVAIVEQVTTIDRSWLEEYLGMLSEEEMEIIDLYLQHAIGLIPEF